MADSKDGCMKLFFYGVLMGEVAPPRVQAMLRGIGPGEPASMRGLLYAVADPEGAHPAMIPGEGVVHGRLHAAGRVDLAALDAFEGYDPANPTAGEYRREAVTVRCADGREAQAEAYFWNRPVDRRLSPIAGGDFAAWLAESGLRPIGS